MKKLISIFLILFIILMNASLVEAAEMGTIKVKGEGHIKLKPDIFTINFMIETKDQNQVNALNENKIKSAKMIDGLVKLGLDKKDIVNKINIRPMYKYEEENKFIGYSVNNTFTIKVRDINKVGLYIEQINKLGATYIYNIEYESSMANQAYYDAMIKAYKNAFKKADVLANSMGFNIKGSKLVEEISSNYYSKEAINLESLPNVKQVEIYLDDIIVNASLNVEFIY